MVDLRLLDIVEKGMKSIAVNWAKENGADEKFLKDLKPLSSIQTYQIVSLLYSEPYPFDWSKADLRNKN